MRTNNKWAVLIVLIVAFALISGCNGGEDSPPATTAAVAGSGPGQVPDFQSVLAEGEVVPVQFVSLSFQAGGVVTDILVEEGEQVVAGDPLIQLDASDLIIARDQAQARVTSAESGVVAAQARLASAKSGVSSAEQQVVAAQARLDLIKAGPRPEEILAAEKSIQAAEAGIAQAAGQRDASLDVVTDSGVEAARAQATSAQAQVLALQEGYDRIIDACFDTPDGEVCPLYGPIEEQTRAQLAAAKAAADAAQAQLNQLLSGATPGQRAAAQGGVSLAVAQRDIAQANLDLLLAGATAAQIAQVEVGVKQAETGVVIAAAGVSQAEAAVKQAEAALATARAGLNSAQAALDRTTLKAPFDGTIGRLTAKRGQLVGPGQLVAILADLSSWIVQTTDLTELDIAKIEPGSEVGVSFDAIPNEKVGGTVTEVSLISTVTQGDVVYEVSIRLGDTAGLPIRWGMTTFIDVEAN